MTLTLVDVLRALRPNESFTIRGEIAYENIQLVDKNKTLPTEEECVQKLAELNYEYEVNEYQRQRAAEYPSMADQQDMQFHDAVNGTTTWKDAIQAVKDKYPKQTMDSDELERRKQQALTDLETES